MTGFVVQGHIYVVFILVLGYFSLFNSTNLLIEITHCSKNDDSLRVQWRVRPRGGTQ